MAALTEEQQAYIQTLADESGYIDPHRVLEEARDEDSPIHDQFEWDDSLAAEKQRLDMASSLIRMVRQRWIIEETTQFVPVYVRDPERPPRSRRMATLTRIALEADLAQRTMMAELDRIIAAIHRARQVAAVLRLGPQLESLLSTVTLVRRKAAAAKPRGRPKKKRPRGKPRKPRGRRGDTELRAY
jgi:hypothetical protein